MKLINKALLFTFIAIASLLSAQGTPPPPPIDDSGRGVGPGAPASPVDMYIYILAIVAVVFIISQARKILIKKAL